jgi:hypothetical protein
MVKASPDLMAMLNAAHQLHLGSWAIAAGAIRNLVWDELHGFAVRTPLQDIDLVFYDQRLNREEESVLIHVTQQKLQQDYPVANWDLVNQASVHLWLQQFNEAKVQAFASLEEGIASWPETATCVGVYLDAQQQIQVLAPHGLEDLFSLRVRHNTTRVSKATYLARLQAKNFLARWPRLQILL